MSFKVKEFVAISDNIFSPIYPVIAEDIIRRCQIKEGVCFDVGGGNGLLGMAIAGITGMRVCIYDCCREILDVARQNISGNGLEGRVSVRQGTVESIEEENESVDLVVSRGSFYFWEDKIAALNEIYRILKPGGFAYIGGGFGSKELEESVDAQMLARDSEWLNNKKRRCMQPDVYRTILDRTGIDDYKIIRPESGLWITFYK